MSQLQQQFFVAVLAIVAGELLKKELNRRGLL